MRHSDVARGGWNGLLGAHLLVPQYWVSLRLLVAHGLMIARRLLLMALLTIAFAGAAQAAGFRWVTGPPYFTATAGTPVLWYTTSPNYFTDPGDLSSYVNHAAANALVAAAAGVWNVPTSAMTLSYGGSLAEHVNGSNAYLSGNGMVFPADVESGNYAAIQIAVIYDSDGSVTDLLLGGGASSPAECRQNGVTESVDSITPSGLIQHAILVLNGRCTGSAAAQQLQLQYQLERAFGRVLGLGWSQTNDNVYTGNPTPTAGQNLHWPILHPIDIVCGQYTYQCLQQPFTLRDDDVASISGLYPMYVNGNMPTMPPAPGKIWSYTQASVINGTLTFPTGQGMQGVNVVLQRQQGGWYYPEAWYDVSTVSGAQYQQNKGNPVTGGVTSMAESQGSTDTQWEGFFNLAWVPDIDPEGAPNGFMYVVFNTEPINPLYIGQYSVGPYVTGSVEPSGTAINKIDLWAAAQPYQYSGSILERSFELTDAANNCTPGNDGVESSPVAVVSSGWWTNVLCGHGHTAWTNFSSRAGRTATIEVTALDESGLATTAKAMPLIGVWNSTDATGTLPTVAATSSPFNTVTLGMTATGVATTTAESLRFVITDARGDGRPDFAYKARVLYADSIAPAMVSANGGVISISGMGFRAGNEVKVNGIVATVSSWTASTIVAVAPPESAFTTNPTGPVDVEVIDLSSGGSTVMTGVLSYSASVAADRMTLISAPSGTAAVGAAAATPFAVRIFLSDGVTPVAGVPVTFTASGAGASFGGCSAAPCAVLTDATGLASTIVTPIAFGSVTLLASAVGASQTASFNAVARSMTIAAQADEFFAAGVIGTWTPQVSVVQNGAAASGVPVTWTASSGMTVAPGTSVTSATGVAQISAVTGPLAAGATATGQDCAWTNVCVGFTAVGVSASAWRLVVDSGASQTVVSPVSFVPVVLMVTDVNGDPVASSSVTIYQTVYAAAMTCPTRGRCPVAPRLMQATSTATSDANGLVSVTPTQIAGVGEVTNLAVAAGTQGFAALAISQGQ
jgi:hypothetical protein